MSKQQLVKDFLMRCPHCGKDFDPSGEFCEFGGHLYIMTDKYVYRSIDGEGKEYEIWGKFGDADSEKDREVVV